MFTNVTTARAEIERKGEFRRTLVRQGATIGANATVVCGHTLGRYCFIAAGAVVTGDVPAFALMAGVPAKQIGHIVVPVVVPDDALDGTWSVQKRAKDISGRTTVASSQSKTDVALARQVVNSRHHGAAERLLECLHEILPNSPP